MSHIWFFQREAETHGKRTTLNSFKPPLKQRKTIKTYVNTTREHVRPPQKRQSWQKRYTKEEKYGKRSPNTKSIAETGKHIRLPQKTYSPRIGEQHNEGQPKEEGRADPIWKRGPQPANFGMRFRLVKGTKKRLDEPEGDAQGWAARRKPRGGGTRLFDPEVEVERQKT